jgi:hypothetical protein
MSKLNLDDLINSKDANFIAHTALLDRFNVNVAHLPRIVIQRQYLGHRL